MISASPAVSSSKSVVMSTGYATPTSSVGAGGGGLMAASGGPSAVTGVLPTAPAKGGAETMSTDAFEAVFKSLGMGVLVLLIVGPWFES